MKPGALPFVILSSDMAMAPKTRTTVGQRPGAAHDSSRQSPGRRHHFQQYGERLFLADAISPECFNGPPLPKEKPIGSLPKAPVQPKTPGSFLPDLASAKHGAAPHQKPQRNEIEWKKDRRRARKDKDHRWG